MEREEIRKRVETKEFLREVFDYDERGFLIWKVDRSSKSKAGMKGKGFIHGVDGVARSMGISTLLLSLLIIPIATELPEKVNSILWIRRDKDTLAFGNITGAMVFQGTLLPAIGIMLTPWQPRIEVLGGVAVTLLAAGWLRLNSKARGLPVWALLVNGALYATYLALTLSK